MNCTIYIVFSDDEKIENIFLNKTPAENYCNELNKMSSGNGNSFYVDQFIVDTQD